ncbi:hypothetical protein WJX74_003515 [Apatococcus lobatus]|uniref:Phospholipid/glycerol acyltransferase domain-containing protein n=1 Tax=Apatococcus lobatus TaxID=904363 RepID=A0AAW1S5G0_9CHLO
MILDKSCRSSGVAAPRTLPRFAHAVSEPLPCRSRQKPRASSKRQASTVSQSACGSTLRLLQPTAVEQGQDKPLLLYLPSTDGTGNSLSPQLPGLVALGFDVRTLYIPSGDRSDWNDLLSCTSKLLREALAERGQQAAVVVGESFGGCLGLRVATAVPDLISHLILVNPATSFDRSFAGLPSLIAGTNLLSLFPEPLYQVAQAVLVPFLVDQRNLTQMSLRAVQAMMAMQPPSSFQDESGKFAKVQTGQSRRVNPRAIHQPSATAAWRLNLLRSGNLPDHQISQIRVPTLLLASSEDRMLPSLQEAARLQRLIPGARRIILADSGHTALLEANVDFAGILERTGFLPPSLPLQPKEDTLISSGGSSVALVSPAGKRSAYTFVQESGRTASMVPTGLDESNASYDDQAIGMLSVAAAEAQPGSQQQAPATSGSTPAPLLSRDLKGSVSPPPPRAPEPDRPNAPSNNTWQIDNLRRALQDSQDTEAGTSTSDSASSNGAASMEASTSSSNGSTSVNPFDNGASPSDNGASSFSENGSHTSSFPKAAGSSSAADQSRVPVSSNGAGRFSDGLQDGQQADAGRRGNVTGRSSWQTQGLFRDENNDEEKGPGPLGDGYTPPSNGAAWSQNGASTGPAGTASSSSVSATAASTATLQSSPAPAGSAASTQSPPVPAAESSTESGAGSRAAAADQKQLRGLQQQKRSASQQLAWDSADQEFDDAATVMNVLRFLASPVVRGAENLPSPLGPKKPILFVGNHTLVGLYDLPFLVYELYLRGFRARGLAHPVHWQSPLGPFFQKFGAVQASPVAAYKLLRDNEAVLLFPGGAREVSKRRGEKYKLKWRESPDFVRMASKLGATIIPFAAVGGDDAFDFNMDTAEILQSPILGPLAREVVRRVDPNLDPEEAVPPLMNLPGLPIPSPIPIPRPERIYFRFMTPIDTSEEKLNVKDSAACMELYGRVRSSVERGIAELQAEQATDPERDFGTRLWTQTARLMPAFDLVRGIS